MINGVLRNQFLKLLRDWIIMPEVLCQSMAAGVAADGPRPGWVPLLSVRSDGRQRQAYATPGAAAAYNKEIRKFRWRIAILALMTRTSRLKLEQMLETYARDAAQQGRTGNRALPLLSV